LFFLAGSPLTLGNDRIYRDDRMVHVITAEFPPTVVFLPYIPATVLVIAVRLRRVVIENIDHD
jgi:hypothetical protein